MKYYLGPWTLDKSGLYPTWRAPKGTSHLIDLRPVPQGESGVGLFGVEDSVVLSDDFRLFGQGKLTELFPKEADRSIFASMVGVDTVDGDTLAQWMYTLLTLYSDPTGLIAVRPLMPKVNGILSACGISKQFDLASPEAQKVIANIQLDYRRIREGSLDGQYFNSKGQVDEQKHLRVLDALREQYKIEASVATDIFIPADLPKEAPVKHETSVADDFDRSNGNIGTATVASISQGWSWTNYNDNFGGSVGGPDASFFQVNTNRAIPLSNATVFAFARSEGALSTDNHECQFTVASGFNGGGTSIGISVRFAVGGDLTQYVLNSQNTNVGSQYDLSKSGSTGTNTFTALGSGGSVATAGHVLLLRANGSTISAFLNGSQIISVTDTSITGNVNAGLCGYFGFVGLPVADDWSAADFAGGGGGATIRTLAALGVG